MAGTARRRIFTPEDETARIQRERVYEEARANLIRRQAERHEREYIAKRRRLFWVAVCVAAGVAMVVFVFLG